MFRAGKTDVGNTFAQYFYCLFYYMYLFSGTHYHFPMDVIEGNILVGDINATLNNGPMLSTGIEGSALKLEGTIQ